MQAHGIAHGARQLISQLIPRSSGDQRQLQGHSSALLHLPAAAAMRFTYSVALVDPFAIPGATQLLKSTCWTKNISNKSGNTEVQKN
jgi:hypothetical protein